jgi:hypothetical protein
MDRQKLLNAINTLPLVVGSKVSADGKGFNIDKLKAPG